MCLKEPRNVFFTAVSLGNLVVSYTKEELYPDLRTILGANAFQQLKIKSLNVHFN